jgi:hypothetical protein
MRKGQGKHPAAGGVNGTIRHLERPTSNDQGHTQAEVTGIK